MPALTPDELAALVAYLARFDPPERRPRDSSWLDALLSAADKIEAAYFASA